MKGSEKSSPKIELTDADGKTKIRGEEDKHENFNELLDYYTPNYNCGIAGGQPEMNATG